MFPSVSHTNRRPSQQQTEISISSPFYYSLDTNYDQACEFTFNEIFDNYQPSIDNQPSCKDSTHSDFAAHFGVFEQNHVFQGKVIVDDQVSSFVDSEAHSSTNEHNSIMHKAITNGSTSKRSTTANISLIPQAINFHIDAEKREMSHAGLKLALRMKTKLEVVDDGFKWRKYGKKKVKSSPYPRNYFKCSTVGCSVKKRIERDANDINYVITTYDGVHNHKDSS